MAMSVHQQRSVMSLPESEMILCIPYTFGPNNGKKGTTEKQIFWHMRNLNIGHIDHIDNKKWCDHKTGLNIVSWFVHFDTWTADQEMTDALNAGGHFELNYDSMDHFWKVTKYVPREKTNKMRTRIVRIVHKARTEEPVEEPTEEPTEEPAEEPAEEPTEEPTEEPVEEEPANKHVKFCEALVNEN